MGDIQSPPFAGEMPNRAEGQAKECGLSEESLYKYCPSSHRHHVSNTAESIYFVLQEIDPATGSAVAEARIRVSDLEELRAVRA
ncbi:MULTISPECIES: hypothetical protein [unclassified Mesorhizobium]|uniref:hypothetical protein n=1 Tax=unclassified Mesorhizobium TaxID=325217 RepID=UPI0012287DC1|nr:MULTISPECIES: hypothetical protein [unclassified Mesorhizobium]MCT2579500.1 hypothetical protein [Mesorhizobium sp. P13.3]MDF3168325.1 hypothetical protein [Mesorhizobium sp. P16.1]MDF3177925.1 hypothetical protein [Mesorhizobium sp. P17.1]MDF3185239.1 hypothetical protein [Mesorhizobium sp. ICCV3110.1]TIS11343.1 MAG: hypothetical protein E5X09_13305 [Mesorhizobium sp.]